jgi:hypothetical protein
VLLIRGWGSFAEVAVQDFAAIEGLRGAVVLALRRDTQQQSTAQGEGASMGGQSVENERRRVWSNSCRKPLSGHDLLRRWLKKLVPSHRDSIGLNTSR